MEAFASDAGEPEPLDISAHRVIRVVRDHAMFLVDRRGRAVSWNEGVGEILGWTEEEWLGQPIRVAFTPEDVAAGVPERELQLASATGRADDDRWMQRKSGERFFAVGAVTRLLGDDGRMIGFLKVLRDFTISKRTEEERERLLGSERDARADAERQSAALTAAIEAIPDGVLFCSPEAVTRCNASALAMLGVASVQDLQHDAAALGRRFRLRREPDGPLVAADELPIARALKGETAVLESWATQPSSGADVYIRGIAAPIVVDGRVIGAVAINSDLTEKLQLQQKRHQLQHVETVLRERDEQLRALVEGVRDYAIFTIGVDGRISSWHEGAALMKGYSAEEAIGMPFAQLFTEEERRAGRPEQEMVIAARCGEFKGDGIRRRKDGSLFEAQVVLTALHGPKGELRGYLKLTQDVSHRRRQEREREELLRNAQTARADAERASHLKGEFLATISHELRTPLSAILGWTHVLENLPDVQVVKQGLAAIARNARVQVQLIEDLLDMNRIESGQLRLDLLPVDLNHIIAAGVDAALPAAVTKGVRLQSVAAPGVGRVLGDAARLQQVVGNMLSNAIKFTPSGGDVAVTLVQSGSFVEIDVTDSGQGIEPAFLPRVFDRFQQQDASTTRRHGGLGLGLSIVRQLVQLHGGSVSAASLGRDKGSAFTVRLPALAALAGAGAPMGVAAAAPTGAGRRLDGVSVLLVDDEPDVRAVTARLLESAGARVWLAASALEGLSVLREKRPDVILSDIGMPVNDGYDFLRWVRSRPAEEGGQTPAAAFTAYARLEDRASVLAAGYQAHLVKPVEPAELLAALAALVAPRAGTGR